MITSLKRGQLLVIVLLVGLACGAASAAPPVVAKLTSIVRQVEVTKAEAARGEGWVQARQNQDLRADYGVRTYKRSKAEITFADKSVLRVNERTDLVVQQAEQMRTIKLAKGSIWVRVTKGANTAVETPTCTAAAKGTTFVVVLLPDGRIRITVLDGEVVVSARGQSVTVKAGESVAVDPSGAIGSIETVSRADLPVDQGGTVEAWWETIYPGVDLRVTPSTTDQQTLRESPLVESGGAIEGPLDLSAWFIDNPEIRLSFLEIAQREVVPDIQAVLAANPGMTLDNYVAQHGSESLSVFEMTPADQTFFEQELGFTVVQDVVRGLQANGGSIDVVIRSRLGGSGRAIYRPGAIQAPSQELRLLDQTDSSVSLLALGLLASLVANNGEMTASAPRLGGWVFGFTGEPGIVGGRGRMQGLLGDTRYTVESNALKLTNDPASDWATRLASVAVLEQNVGEWTVFAGRRRFFHGPVFDNLLSTQLIANRYSGAGVRTDRGRWAFEAAWLYDSNPAVDDAQSGALASLLLRGMGGVLGVHLLTTDEIDNGHGRTVSVSLPAVPDVLDAYAEVGKGLDRAQVETYGLYFPGLYQKTDIDLFMEYAEHEGVGNAFSITAHRQFGDNLLIRAYANWINDEKTVGMGLLWRFGTVKSDYGFGAAE